MKKERLLVFVLLMVLSSTVAIADFGDSIQKTFGWLGKLDLAKGDVEAAIWAKLILGLMMFGILYLVGEKVLEKAGGHGADDKGKKIVVLLSFLISLAVVLVPNPLIINVLRSYQIIGIAFLTAIPIGLLVAAWIFLKNLLKENHPRIYHIATAVVCILILTTMGGIRDAIGPIEYLDDFDYLFDIPWFILAGSLLWHVGAAVFGSKGGESSHGGEAASVGDRLGSLISKGKAFFSAERTLGRKLKQSAGNIEKESEHVVKDLDAMMIALGKYKADKENGELKREIEKGFEKITPEIRKEEEFIGQLDEQLDAMKKWASGEYLQSKTIGEGLVAASELLNKLRAEAVKLTDGRDKANCTNVLESWARLIANWEGILKNIKDAGVAQSAEVEKVKSESVPRLIALNSEVKKLIGEAAGFFKANNVADAYKKLGEAKKKELEIKVIYVTIKTMVTDIRALIDLHKVKYQELERGGASKVVESLTRVKDQFNLVIT